MSVWYICMTDSTLLFKSPFVVNPTRATFLLYLFPSTLETVDINFFEEKKKKNKSLFFKHFFLILFFYISYWWVVVRWRRQISRWNVLVQIKQIVAYEIVVCQIQKGIRIKLGATNTRYCLDEFAFAVESIDTIVVTPELDNPILQRPYLLLLLV